MPACYESNKLQVLSESVSKALMLSKDPEVSETAKFILMFDRFFDTLNVNNFSDGKESRKVFQNPFRSNNDFRIKVNSFNSGAMYVDQMA